MLVIASALSIQDPRERPTDKQQAAAEMHARFKDETSDFLSYVKLWEHVREQQRELSSSAFRRMCRREFLVGCASASGRTCTASCAASYASLDLSLDSAEPDPGRIHLSLLAGLLSHIGLRDPDKREYLGARGARFAVVPGSALYRKQPRFLMAAELVETNRMWGRVVARVEPEWAEKLGAHLVKRSYSEPHWERKRAAVMATERVTLYGVPLVAARKVGYSAVDPAMCRDLFIRQALVEGDWETHHAFWQHNVALLEDVEKLEDKARRRDIKVDDQTLYDFYDARLPADVVSGRHFDAWWKQTRRATPRLLDLSLDVLARDVIDVDAYPDVWRSSSLALPLDYSFTPGAVDDGVTVEVPLAVLNQVRATDFEWLVPGCGTSSSSRCSSRCPSRCASRSCLRPTRRARCLVRWARLTARCSTSSSASCAGALASSFLATRGTGPGCRRTCGRRSRWSRLTGRCWRAAAIWRRCRRRWLRSCRRRCRRPLQVWRCVG